jgi:hypothetical protein
VEFFELSGTREVLCKLPSSLLAFKFEKLEPTSRCMYNILLVEFTKVGEIHVFLVDLLKQSNAKVLCMETEKTRLSKKPIRLRFNMEDQRVVALETQDAITTSECEEVGA